MLYLQVLDSPLDAPAMVLQGCLALLGGHTMHRVLHLGGARGHCLLPPLVSKKPVTEARDHWGCPHPWFCLQGALTAGGRIILIPGILNLPWAWVGHNIPSLETLRGP